MKVYTVTLNPCVDVTLWTDGLDADRANRVEEETREMGGKGINVSRVLHSFGVDTICYGLAGKDNYKEWTSYLDKAGLRYAFQPVDGMVRENLTLRFEDKTIKFNRKGPFVFAAAVTAFTGLLQKALQPEDIVVFAGSLPENVSLDDYADMMLAAKQKGARIVIDSDALTLKHYQRTSPWLIKPNIHELRKFTGMPCGSMQETAEAAQKLQSQGVEQVLVSLGADGMLYVSKDAAYRVKVPEVVVKSTVGAGDSSLAGFIAGIVGKRGISNCLRLSASCGTACAMREGTLLATKELAAQIENAIQLETYTEG